MEATLKLLHGMISAQPHCPQVIRKGISDTTLAETSRMCFFLPSPLMYSLRVRSPPPRGKGMEAMPWQRP